MLELPASATVARVAQCGMRSCGTADAGQTRHTYMQLLHADAHMACFVRDTVDHASQ